jgi:hypothetical protein
LLRNNSDDSKQITVSETVSFYLKPVTFRNIVLFRKNYLREKLFLSPLATKQGLVMKQNNVSKRLSFDVKPTLLRNIILFRKVSIDAFRLLFATITSRSCDAVSGAAHHGNYETSLEYNHMSLYGLRYALGLFLNCLSSAQGPLVRH